MVNSGLSDKTLRRRGKLYKISPDCGICGVYIPLELLYTRYITVDHIVALANGGKNWGDNIQLAHKKCNSIKSDLPQGHPDILLHPKWHKRLDKLPNTKSGEK